MRRLPRVAANGEHVLTVDLGTSGPKVALFTLDGHLVDGDFEPVELLLSPGGGAEQRPAEWWNGAVTATRRLLERAPVPVDDVAAVSVTGQFSGTVPVDREGCPLADAIIWMDSRGAPQIRRLVGGRVRVAGYEPRKLRTWVKLTGGAPGRSGKDPLAHILWLEEERPDVARRTFKYLEPKDWLNQRLTGRFCSTIDTIVLHWVTDNRDPHRVDYHPDLLALTGLRREQLPDLVRAVDVVGPLLDGPARELGLPAGLPVIGGTGDVQSAAVGSGAVRDLEGHVYFGTSSWVTCHVPFKKTDLLHNVASLPSPLPGRYWVADEQETAGACLEWLRDQVVYADDGLGEHPAPADALARLDRLAETVPAGSDGVIFTPWLNGERTPIEDHTVRAGWHHQSLRTTRAHLVRSVLEGVALNTRWLLGCVERFCGRPFPSLRFIGGGATSSTWSGILADVLDRPIERVADPFQANGRGAALLAALALGRLDVDEIGRAVQVTETVWPDPAHRRVYDEAYRELRNLYRHNRATHRRLEQVR
ncbi:MAG: FGGY-family carbohydrate kinase [Acidimicrobiia bacterium]|nr:FGGY-family carbohydrate kinase [Acidimicrobiia bacterium]